MQLFGKSWKNQKTSPNLAQSSIYAVAGVKSGYTVLPSSTLTTSTS